MEVRARNNCNGVGTNDAEEDSNNNHVTMAELLEKASRVKVESSSSPAGPKSGSKSWRSGILGMARSEAGELGRAALRLLRGQGSWLAYLMIPAVTAMLWLLVCMLTTRAPSMSLEQRLSQKYLKEYYEAKVNEEGVIKQFEERQEAIHMEEGESVHVIMAMPFLDVNPLGATEYITTLEWILLYASVPVTFHVITNTDSTPYVQKVVDRVNQTTGGVDFHLKIHTLADIMETTTTSICPKFTLSEEFCDILMGKMTPLLFPQLFPELDLVVYIHSHLRFQDDIGLLHQQLHKLRRSKAALALAPEQTNAYMRAFAGWQRLNPSTRLGRPPPDGKPGYNTDLMLMDLEKLRASATYKSYFSEIRLNKLIKNYFYHSLEEIPSLGDVLNLMAAASEELFSPTLLGCEWNRNARSSTDPLERKFNVCPGGTGHVRAWNGSPSSDRVMGEKETTGGVSVSRRKVPHEGEEFR